MGDVINLGRYRKQKERQRREAEAAVNRARAGRAKPEVQRDRMLDEQARRDLDGKKRDEPA